MTPIDEQTILVTGSTDGIGEITAHKLADQGARMLIHGRKEQKVSRVAREIRTKTGIDKIEEYTADFSSLDNVRRLAGEIRANHDSLDVLINNAGIGFGSKRELSGDDYELRFAVNYLAPFLLTRLLLPAVQQAAPSRIVNVSSAGQHPVDFDNVMLEKQYDSRRAYGQSKLALIMFTIDLAEQVEDQHITVNSLHPGTYLNTKMVREAGISPLGEPETGADAIVYLATAPELENITGKYFDQKTQAKTSAQAYDAAVRQKLWELSEGYTGL